MQVSKLLRTKFIIPPKNPDLLPRPHLIDWMKKQKDKRLILISAPPGYGKTSLLTAYLAVSNAPVSWFQLDPGDSDPTVFLANLIASIQQASSGKFTDFGQASLTLLDSPDATLDPKRVIAILINELIEIDIGPHLLVIEDYHFITNPVIHTLVDFLIGNAPQDIRFIISTRTDPPFGLARLRARGLLAELRAPDLRFKEEEVYALLENDLPGIPPDILLKLHEKTEGWAAALQIMRSSLTGADPESATQVIANLSGTHHHIFDYLAEEVFRRQPENRQTFLVRTAVLGQMNAAVCEQVSGVGNAQALLEELESQNLFLTSLDTQRQWFRYHTLFREFLLSRLRREQPELARQLEREAGEFFLSTGEAETAFRHFIRVPDEIAAARAALQFAPAYAERGRSEALKRYLSMLSSDTMRRYPELLLQHGNAHLRLGDAARANGAYEDARHAFEQKKDQSGVSRALTCLAEIQRASGHYNQAEKLAQQALEASSKKDHTARATALMALAKSTGFLSGTDEGRKLAELAVEEARKAGNQLSRLSKASYFQSLGQICWWQGDPQATVQYCKEALQLAPDEISPIAAQAHISLVSPYLYWREFSAAAHHAERGLEIAQTLHLTELLPAAYTALGNVLTRLGETARAETALRESVEMAQQLGIASYELLMATGYLAYNLYGQGRVDEAWQLAEGALWSYTGSPHTYEAFVCRSVLADVALEKRQFDRAEMLFNELLEIGKRRQFRIPLAMVYFGLAYIHLVTDRMESGVAHAQSALKLIKPTRAVQLFIDQGEKTRIVCEALIEAGETNTFIERVLAELPSKRKALRISFRSATGGIVVQCLGDFSVIVNGQEITQEQWVSAKARDLLAYFITYRRERITADRAFDAIWGEKPGRTLTAFHTALSRLRSALRKEKTSPRLILVETGEYRLDAARFRIDVDDFDTALAKARAASSERLAAVWYEQAVNLYGGEYMQNLYFDWIMPERRRLVQAYLATLRLLADFHSSQERFTNALELLQRALRVDNLLEDVHCQAMRVYMSLGDRAGLARQYNELQEILQDQLGMEPLDSSKELYEKLMAKIS